MIIDRDTLLDPGLRHVIECGKIKMHPYDRYGEPRTDMDWLPLSGRAEDGYECFLLRFHPGAESTPHQHSGYEQFLMLDGELEDSDGRVFGPGDFVSFDPGSRHCSVSHDGCTMLVILRGKNHSLV